MDKEFGAAMFTLVMQQASFAKEVKALIAESKEVADSAEFKDWLQHVQSFEAKAVALFTDIPKAVR